MCYAILIFFLLLIIGTFEPEKTNEKIAYGLVHPIQTFDPIYVQIFNYKYIFGRFFESKSWSERFSVLFKGPGILQDIFIGFIFEIRFKLFKDG